MDYKTARTLAKRFLVPTIIVLLMLASGFGYVWSEYKEVLKEKDKIAAERKLFDEEKASFEKNRMDMSISFSERKTELEKREFILQQLEKENHVKLSMLQQRSNEYDTAFKKMDQAQAEISAAQNVKTASEKIERLMSEFSAMGVNLNDPLKCNDADSLKKHNATKAKYSEIYTLAEAYGLKEKYNHFFFRNSQSMYSICNQ